MNARNQRLCVWAGPAMMVIWMIGFWPLAGFVPPPAPGRTAAEIAAMYRDHTTSIRLGLLLTVVAVPLLAPFCTVISLHMKRIEGRYAPLANIQLMLAGCLVLAFYFPLMILQTAAYRQDRPDDVLLALDDLGWMMFVGVVTITVLQIICIGVAILQDQGRTPIFPRWSGYFNVWVGLLLSPGCLILFFKNGPLAWNGIFTFWLPLTAFAIWFVVMTVLLLKAIEGAVREVVDEVTGRPEPSDTLDRIELLTARIAALEGQRQAAP